MCFIGFTSVSNFEVSSLRLRAYIFSNDLNSIVLYLRITLKLSIPITGSMKSKEVDLGKSSLFALHDIFIA